MNYLTNYYKNLSEQLQEKVNHLQKLLKEFDDPWSDYWGGHPGFREPKPKGSTSERDATKEMEEYNKSVKAIESHPESQRLMVDALAGTWSDQHGGSESQRSAFRSDIERRLRDVSGGKGFESFGHAVEAMIPIIASTPSWREEVTENLKQSMHPEKFKTINLERRLLQMARDHSMEVGADAIRRAKGNF